VEVAVGLHSGSHLSTLQALEPLLDRVDGERHLARLRRAQIELDLAPGRCRHHLLHGPPDPDHDRVDVAGFGTGKGIVLLPYGPDAYDPTQGWLRTRGLRDVRGRPRLPQRRPGLRPSPTSPSMADPSTPYPFDARPFRQPTLSMAEPTTTGKEDQG
jgi:hypothetical protein